VRRGLLALLAVLAISPLAAACRQDSSDGTPLTERWLRVGEAPNAEVVVYDEKLPPNLVELLNPGATAEGEKVQLPVHPNGKLVGSYVVRKPDGSHLVWLIYDVAEAPSAVAKRIQEQLDARPWQVVGAQADASGTLLRFQSSTGGDLQGTAIVNQRPGASTYELVVERDGKRSTLKVGRGSTVPDLAASLGDDLVVKRVDAGAAKAAGLKEGDKIVRLGGTDVSDRKSLAAAQQAIANEKNPSTSVTYVMQVIPSTPVDPPVFTEPVTLALPDRFPVKAFFDPMIVTEFQWIQRPGASGYSVTAVSKDGSTALAGRLRDALQKDGWQILQDVPSGGATQMQFQHSDGRSGVAEVGPFEPDSAYTRVELQVQTGQG
jgi:hypothetical protein